MNYHDFYLNHPEEFTEALKEIDWDTLTADMDGTHVLNNYVEVDIVDHIKREFSYFMDELTPPTNPKDEYNPEENKQLDLIF